MRPIFAAGSCAAALLLASALPSSTIAADPAAFHARVTFACKWWSEAQMAGLNPNSPPPKTTDVVITKWEYSDPVGVPHPDVVDAVIALENGGARAAAHLRLEVTARWKVGPIGSPARSTWSAPGILRRNEDLSIAPGATQEIRVPVELKPKMDAEFKRQRWPHALRVTVVLSEMGSGREVARGQAELPIHPGD